MSEPHAPPRSSRIPDFRSREEEAEFWDTHEFTDFLDESWPVEIEASQALRDRVEARAREEAEGGLIVPLKPEVRAELSRRADERGVGPAALAQLWIEERLRAERAAS
jgi:hypothetical protein